MRLHRGRPTIFVGGRAESPVFYALTDSPGARWTWEEIPRWNIQEFGRRGFRLVQVSLWLEDLWREDGSVDVDRALHQIRGVLAAHPQAAISIRLHVNAPFWWNKRHPDETTDFADVKGEPFEEGWGVRRHLDGDLDAKRLASLASRKWRDDASRVTVELLRRLADAPEGDAVFGFHISGGVSHEWHYWSFIAHDPDTGPAMTRYFRSWLARKYDNDDRLRVAWADTKASLASATVPGRAERNGTRDGIFRNPAVERRVMDYYEAQHEVVADDILHFGRLVKDTWPRPVVTGVFYGYFFMLFSRQATGGHLALRKIMESPYIDYLAAPQSYWAAAHGPGGSGQSRALQESARLYGKLVIDEMDQGTSVKAPFGEPDPAALATDIGLLRRNTLQPLARGMGLWFYDFGPNDRGGAWAHPTFGQELTALKGLFDARLERELTSESDVLLVWDDDVYFHMHPAWTPISESSIDDQSNDLFHTGAAVDQVYLRDLGHPRLDLDRYRVVIFGNAYRLDEAARRFIETRIARDGRHIVWSYAPGYTDGRRNDTRLVAGATGFRVEPVELEGKPRVVVEHPSYPQATFGLRGKVSPLFAISDPDATPIGRFDGTAHVAVARKVRGTATAWYAALPWRDPGLLRSILREGGAHVYSEGGDALHAGNGVVWIHSASGGRRTLRLRSGRRVELTLEPNATAAVDSRSGEVLFR